MEIRFTADGSHTLYHPELDEHYHSIHGAVTESLHVFIGAGFRASSKRRIRLFEMGFGTGLNALLTWMEAEKSRIRVEYTSIEIVQVPLSLALRLNYTEFLDKSAADKFNLLHSSPWGVWNIPDTCFRFRKMEGDIREGIPRGPYDLVYYDAFAPGCQPELWTMDIFKQVYDSMTKGAVLITYSSKVSVRNNLLRAGFQVQTLPGPPGKREITRAVRVR